ncbi:MAG TPA: xanthine dehydrogenase accessory protein XdhC [Steroidobacteraceae bacterium]|nr:xanthine dehydrogenase accessory protein XdhC [Steroidobacteraceae bacterium]
MNTAPPRHSPTAAPAGAAAPAVATATAGDWLAPLQGHWIETACARLARHPAVVRVTVIALRGSAPREAGATMLVDPLSTVGSIGGGRLEWRATLAARELLGSRAAPVCIAELILGPDLGQCCGGRVELWLERLTRDDLPWLLEAQRRVGRRRPRRGVPYPASDMVVTELRGGALSHRLQPSTPGGASLELCRAMNGDLTLRERVSLRRPQLWIFGAGHVGQALVRLLAELALFDITWVDSRPELLPAGMDGVSTEACANPVDLIGSAPAAARYVVLTHDHALDYALCRAILRRGDSAWLGLIGSASKSARFRSRLRRDGVGGETPSALTCPIGIPGIASKLPASIAIAIAAQLLQQVSVFSSTSTSKHDLACGAAGGSCSFCGAENPLTT